MVHDLKDFRRRGAQEVQHEFRVIDKDQATETRSERVALRPAAVDAGSGRQGGRSGSMLSQAAVDDRRRPHPGALKEKQSLSGKWSRDDGACCLIVAIQLPQKLRISARRGGGIRVGAIVPQHPDVVE